MGDDAKSASSPPLCLSIQPPTPYKQTLLLTFKIGGGRGGGRGRERRRTGKERLAAQRKLYFPPLAEWREACFPSLPFPPSLPPDPAGTLTYFLHTLLLTLPQTPPSPPPLSSVYFWLGVGGGGWKYVEEGGGSAARWSETFSLRSRGPDKNVVIKQKWGIRCESFCFKK